MAYRVAEWVEGRLVEVRDAEGQVRRFVAWVEAMGWTRELMAADREAGRDRGRYVVVGGGEA